MSTAGCVYRQVRRPTPLLTVGDPAIAAQVLLRALRSLQHKRGCGAYVFVDPARQLYVIAETRPAAPQWIREHFGWLVGFYRTTEPTDSRIPVLKPTLDGLTEDIADQLAQLAHAVDASGGAPTLAA